MPMRRIPATIVTGFLGAGKTSLVRHLLAHAAGHRLAVIVNEFGELGIDRELLLGCGDATCAEDDIVELANGCLCCTVADDFLPTLTRLIERAEPPGHIVIETSGLALPKPLVQAFAWPEIRTRMTVDGVVTVIDAAAVAAGPLRRRSRGGRPAARRRPGDRPRQSARRGVHRPARLRRSGDPEQDRSARCRRASPRCAPRSRRGCGRGSSWSPRAQGRVPPAVALGLAAAAEDDLAVAALAARARRRARPRRFRQLCRRVPGRWPIRAAFRARLAAAIRAHDVLRVKGFVDVPGPRPPPGRAGGRRPHRAAFRSALAGRRGARDAARRDRQEGPRPRRDRARRWRARRGG